MILPKTMEGQVLSGKYRVEAKLGIGGMGTVYKATDTRLNRFVALKVLHPQFSGNPIFLKRFDREASAMAQLDHKNIIRVFDVAEQEDLHYIVMEYFPGTNVKHRLAKEKFDSYEAIQIGIETADGLTYAHTHGIIHRDIKPENIMIHDDGRVKIADFGIAAAADEASLTVTGQVIGTPVYMAPEQAQNEHVDKRADLYALGVLLYEMVTGRAPLYGLSTTAVLAHLISGKGEFNLAFAEDIPLSLRNLITALVKRNPQERPSDMNLLIKQMQRIKRELAQPAPTETIVSFNPPSFSPEQGEAREDEEEEQDRTIAMSPVEGQRPRTTTRRMASPPPKKASHAASTEAIGPFTPPSSSPEQGEEREEEEEEQDHTIAVSPVEGQRPRTTTRRMASPPPIRGSHTASTEAIGSFNPPSSSPEQGEERKEEEEDQDRIIAASPVEGQRPRTTTRRMASPPPKKVSHFKRWLAMGMGAVVVVGGGIYYFFSSSQMEAPPALPPPDQTVESAPVETPPPLTPPSPSSETVGPPEPLDPIVADPTPLNTPVDRVKQENPVVTPKTPQPTLKKAPEKQEKASEKERLRLAGKPDPVKQAPQAPKLPTVTTTTLRIKEQKQPETVSRDDIAEQIASLRKSEQQLDQARQKAKAVEADQWASPIYQAAKALEEKGDAASQQYHDFIQSQQFEEAKQSFAQAQTLLDQSAEQFSRSASKAAEQKAEDERDVKAILADFKKAYEGRNLTTLRQMGTPSSGQARFLEQLFSSYSTIYTVVSPPVIHPQLAYAVITITKLLDLQGNVVIPGERWKETRITLQKSDNQWKKITW